LPVHLFKNSGADVTLVHLSDATLDHAREDRNRVADNGLDIGVRCISSERIPEDHVSLVGIEGISGTKSMRDKRISSTDTTVTLDVGSIATLLDESIRGGSDDMPSYAEKALLRRVFVTLDTVKRTTPVTVDFNDVSDSKGFITEDVDPGLFTTVITVSRLGILKA
jgi:hypothetical protein